MSEQVVGYVQAVLSESKFVVQFEDVQKREISAFSVPYVCEKQQFGKEEDKTIYDLPKRGQGELLTFNGGPVCK